MPPVDRCTAARLARLYTAEIAAEVVCSAQTFSLVGPARNRSVNPLSDHAQIIVDIEVSAEKASELAGLVRAWLIDQRARLAGQVDQIAARPQVPVLLDRHHAD